MISSDIKWPKRWVCSSRQPCCNPACRLGRGPGAANIAISVGISVEGSGKTRKRIQAKQAAIYHQQVISHPTYALYVHNRLTCEGRHCRGQRDRMRRRSSTIASKTEMQGSAVSQVQHDQTVYSPQRKTGNLDLAWQVP